MSNIELNYSNKGFDPAYAPANPGDTITINNNDPDDLELTFTCGSVADPLTNITSPVMVNGNSSVWGDVRNAASNHTITFTMNGSEAMVAVGPANYQVDANPESISPTTLDVNPLDNIVFLNTSTSTSIQLDVDSPTADPFGAEIGMVMFIDPTAQKDGVVQRSAAGTQVKVTVKGTTGQTSTINVGSGDTETGA